MNVLDLALRRAKLRKVSGTNGGEWQGPCPGCGGNDRFHVWPVQNDGAGAYWCRGCDKGGDAIQFLRDFENMTFAQACAELHVEVPGRPGSRAAGGRPFGSPGVPPSPPRPEFTPAAAVPPADLWQEHAEKLVAWSQEQLARNAEVLTWLAGRGISVAAAADYRLGWNPGEGGKDLYRARKGWGLSEVLNEKGRPKVLWIPRGLVIPWIESGVVHRIRIRRTEGEPRYYVLPGSSGATMLLEPSRRAFVIVEAELDAIAIAAAAGNDVAGAVAMGSAAAKPDAEAYEVLQRALQILVSLDYDAAGARPVSWWREHFERSDRWPVPKGKDPGDAVRLGTDLNSWIRAGLPPALTLPSAASMGGQGCPVGKVAPASGKQAGAEERFAVGVAGTAAASPVKAADTTGLPLEVVELYGLLRKNPSVRIIASPSRGITVLRDGKYVGGRIGELVFRSTSVFDYLANHPAEEIHVGNFIYGDGGDRATA